MPIEPYLFFNGRCEEAIDFYKRALGAEVDMMMRFREAPQSPPEGVLPKDFGDKIMHSQLRIGDAIFLASDGMTKGEPSFKGISLTLTAADEDQCKKWFDALAKDGKVEMPLGKTFFAKSFGSVADRFGVSWMVIVPAEMPG